jgi:Sushi repeat (SCR repeat)
MRSDAMHLDTANNSMICTCCLPTAHCDVLPTVGNALMGNGNTAVGNTVNFTCQTGFIFPDNTTTINSTCGADRNWTNSLINTTCNSTSFHAFIAERNTSP